MSPSERDPLINPQHGLGTEEAAVTPPTKLGPLEISRSTRYGILAGIWTATFLSVCDM